MKENRWTFTSQGNPKAEELIWLRDPFRSFEASFSPEVFGDFYLTIVQPGEKNSPLSDSEFLSFLKARKKKAILVAEGFAVRLAWPILRENPNFFRSSFLIFPQPLPISGFSLSFFEKADWFLRNLPQLGKSLMDPARIERIWASMEKENLYMDSLSLPLGILLPRTIGPLSSQSEILGKLSTDTKIYRWESRNRKFTEPDTEKLSKILESFLKSGGQKPGKIGSRTRF